MGDPIDNVDYGPLVSSSARTEVHKMVKSSIEMGAKINLGGKIPNSEGAYYPITVLSNVQPGMPAFEEEIFGPVFSIIEANDNDHAIDLANNSKFGPWSCSIYLRYKYRKKDSRGKNSGRDLLC